MPKATQSAAKARKPRTRHILDEDQQVKLALAAILRRVLKERGITQVRAAEMLHITQPNIWEVLHDRLRGYSVSRLMRFLIALDHDIEITIRQTPPSRKPRLTVEDESIAPKKS